MNLLNVSLKLKYHDELFLSKAICFHLHSSQMSKIFSGILNIQENGC